MDWRTLFPGKEKGKSAEKIQVQDQSNTNILTNRAEIHQALLSQFSLLKEFFIGKVTVKA